MKKLVSLLLAMMLVCACIPAMAEETPEGYPEVVPGIDFGGQKIWLYQYFDDNLTVKVANGQELNEKEQDTLAYRQWIMDTYNCEIEATTEQGDWGSIATNLTNFCIGGDANKNTLSLWIIPPDFIWPMIKNNQLASWSNNDLVDITDDDHWNQAMNNFLTWNDNVYGVFAGIDAHGGTEVRQLLYFNKQILQDAGIEPDTVYDMQADGTWTWDAFEDMLKKIQKDTDNDGVIDIWGMTGNNNDMSRIAVFSNGGSFVEMDPETGKLSISANSQETLDGLAFAKEIYSNYFFQGETDENGTAPQWDYFINAWKDGKYGFYIHQAYAAFNPSAEMDDGPEWGVVMFPKGRSEKAQYVTISSDNPVVVPAIYDAETIRNIQYIYSLWAAPTPGYEDPDEFLISFYEKASDERAVDETYVSAMKNGVIDTMLYLGSANDLEGQDYLWNLSWQTPQEITEAKTPTWQGLVDNFNNPDAQ